VEFGEVARRAREIRALYAEWETRRDGHAWTAGDLMAGFVGDVGDLSKLVAAHAGRRPGPDDLQGALAHELSDCLWSVLALADALGVDLERSFTDTMDGLETYVREQLPPP
jgi:NTP pyrophosphatase (non-canonical NTP hydrolase)